MPGSHNLFCCPHVSLVFRNSAFNRFTSGSSCCGRSVESWVDDRRCPPLKPLCAFLAGGVAPYPLSDKQPFRRDSGREGLGTTGQRFLYMTGVSIPRGLARMGKTAELANNICTFLSLREPRQRHMLACSARGLSVTTLRTCVGAPEDHVPECFVQAEHHHRL